VDEGGSALTRPTHGRSGCKKNGPIDKDKNDQDCGRLVVSQFDF
jgi:hypothetical protein